MAAAGTGIAQNLVSSNAGYSGTPLWKLKQQGALARAAREAEEAERAAQVAAQAQEEEGESNLRLAVDAVSLGLGDRPLVRHVIVKDLRKVAARSKVQLPTTGLFESRAPLQLFALFDGQSSAEAPGPFAAEWCAKQVLPKLIRNLSALPAGYENETFVKATLSKTVQDLDKDILASQPTINDGCGAALALLVGERLFTAVCGKCEVVLCEAGPQKGSKQGPPTAINMGSQQGHWGIEAEQEYLSKAGGTLFQGEGGVLLTSSPTGAVASISRSLGDRAWKGAEGGVPGSLKLLRGMAETRVTEISWAEKHTCLVIVSAPVAETVSAQDRVLLATDFSSKPRAASGVIAAKAQNNGNAQCAAVVLYFLPKESASVQKEGAPAAKKAKKEAESVRLRHIVVKHRDCGQPVDPVRNVQITRSPAEAEALVRRALTELIDEAKTIKLPTDANKAKLAALQPTPKYISLCKEMSECSTAQKGGGMMGDLGWMDVNQIGRFGQAFADTVKALQVGQWSDITSSEHGIHILQRIA